MFVVYLATNIGFYLYSFIMFDKLYTAKKVSIIFRLGFTLLAALAMAFLAQQNIPVLNFTYSFSTLMLLTVLFYKLSNKNFLIYNSIFLVIVSIIEMLAMVVMMLITGLTKNEILDSSQLLAATLTINWIMIVAITRGFILSFFEKSFSSIKNHEIIMFIGLIIGEIMIFNYLYNTMFKDTSYKVIIILLIFLALDLYLTYLLRTISKTYKTEKELELLTQQSKIQLSAYNELNEKYNASRRVIHDVKKHIASLDGLINSNKAEEAAHYKDLLDAELNKLIPRFECDDPILTVVINNKLEAAETLNVDFRVDAEFTDIGFISNLDITAIFSNLLDNAFEACCELPEDRRRVWLSITRRNYFVFIYLENTFDKVTMNYKNEFKSTKENHHGLGLSNIRIACEKYSGSFNAHTESDLFITEILIPIPAPVSDTAEAENTAP